ncbi:alpha-D-ribose 1-methylphosphonate 5-triphosphate diphosphatase [Spirochaetia bacterium]|nr:alpha-D-ribose 1-methylphosphonate 5-triphosphate diphosphatase [Spirochaetia bacterium]
MKTCIINADIVSPNKVLPNQALIIEDDRISEILSMEKFRFRNKEWDSCFDARGAFLMPGFIDIHSDYIEGIIQPRPTSLMDFEMGLREAERQLVGQGVTMIYHSLSLMNSKGNDKHCFRTRENLERLVGHIKRFHQARHLIHHRFHARYEIDNIEIYPYLVELLEEGAVHELSFMDHTPGQGQYRDLEIFARSYPSWDADCSGKTMEEILATVKNKPMASREMLKRLSELAKKNNIPLASHDDDTLEKLLLMKNEFQVGISEFPIELEVAKKAKDEGLFVVVGAPNVILGASHSGNLSAREAIREGAADILCSDYYPASLLYAAFTLEDEKICTLPQAVNMLTLNPARAVGISIDYGSLEQGKKADILAVRREGRHPMINACFIDGEEVLRLEYRRGAA